MSKMLSREQELAEKEVLMEKYKTALKKTQFVNELKTGLGAEIKKNPVKSKIIKKTWGQKLMISLGKIFTKF